MNFRSILLTFFSMIIFFGGISCSKEEAQGTKTPKKGTKTEVPAQEPKAEPPAQDPKAQPPAPNPDITAPPSNQAAADAKKVFVLKDSLSAPFDKIPGEILKDFTLVGDAADLKAGGNVLLVTSTSSERIFNEAALDKQITDMKNKGYKVTVLALRLSGVEVDPEDYGLPAKHGIDVFRVLVGPTGQLKDQITSTKENIDKLKAHLRTP